MNFDQIIKGWWMLINYMTLNKLPNLYVPWYPSLKMNKIMPACLSVSWGCWQSKWVHVQCMRFSREKCWLNVRFAFATLNAELSCSAPHLSPWKGLCCFWWVTPVFCFSFLALAGLLPGSAWWKMYYAVWNREWGDGGKTQSPPTLLLSDRECRYAARLWVMKGIVDSWSQGANIWAGACSTEGYRKGQNRAAIHTNEYHERAIDCLPLRFCPSWVMNLLVCG